MKLTIAALLILTLQVAAVAGTALWPAPTSPVIPKADGYIPIPNAAVAPRASHLYRAVFDATLAADQPAQIVPALNMAGSELNVLVGSGLTTRNARFVVVFHGGALDAILGDAQYRAKHQVANPNLEVISGLKKAGVELYVCGQNLAFEGIDPKAVTPDVKIATDALIVLMAFQNEGYALMKF